MKGLPHLEVSVRDQLLEVLEDGKAIHSFPVSTSRFGTGFEEGSNRTPTGNFVISEKHGGGAPLATIFKGRIPVGVCDLADPSEDDGILTRILRLDGRDGENSNSYRRYIYIHGTNHENLIGQPASIGCIRMRNEDVAALYDLIPVGATVHISAD